MRKLTLFGVLTFANFATAGLGKGLTGEEGKLAIGNLAPVLFLLILGPYFLARTKGVRKNTVAFFLLFNVSALLSFAVFMIRYGWPPNVPVLLFQDVEILFSALLVWYARRHSEDFLQMARVGIICSALISLAYGVLQLHGSARELFFVTFGMDDKSQAAVLFCCQAYILLRFFDGALERAVSIGLLVMSFMTLSRLPVVLLPASIFALATRTRYGVPVAVAIVCAAVIGFASASDDVLALFKVFDRLSSTDAVAGDDATTAHLLLIQSALQMKFSDAWAFFLGTGPGNFSQALTSFPISIRALASLDPLLISEARIGRAPMHSTPISMLLDYNIVIIGLLVFMGLRALRFVIRSRHYLDLFFLVSLFAASMFYSLHNKPYLFLTVATIAVGVMGKAEPAGSPEEVNSCAMRPA
jgi:hypothetical protein